MNRALLSSVKMDCETPDEFYGWLDRCFRFTIDLAASKANTKHPRFYGVKDNALHQSWEGETGWLNPEYGRNIGQWLEKSRDSAQWERALVVNLVPARVDTSWWRTFVMQRDGKAGRLRDSFYWPATGVHWYRWEGLTAGVYFHDARLPFEGMDNGAPFPSAVVVFASPKRKRPTPAYRSGDVKFLEGWTW